MEESSNYILYFFIGLFIIMVITKCINLSLVKLTDDDLKELDDYKIEINEATIENFSTNEKLKDIKNKNSYTTEAFYKSSFNKNKDKFKNIKKESLYDYHKRLKKIDSKWSRNSRDVLKKFFKFKDEFLLLF